MRSTEVFTTLIFLTALILHGPMGAQHIVPQRPVIQTKYTADPAPLVYKDTVFLYTSHDEDDAMGFKMKDWLLYSSTDMVNWTDHGAVASLDDFDWVPYENGAWAVQCIERNGKFYLYCPMPGGVGIGVLVADSPYGPFKDPLGKPLIKNSNHDIDPTILIDDDGQAYMYWGNPKIYYVKLNEDMISYSGAIMQEPTTPQNYQEGPWVWKRKNTYYMAYASSCCPEGIGYAMSDSPTGPWDYKGMIIDASEKTRGNHPGIIEFRGKSYVFGHSYDLLKQRTPKFYERRSVDMDLMEYNPDGSIKNREYFSVEGPQQVGILNPFQRVEAETMAWSEGVKTRFETEWEGDFDWDRGQKIADHRFVSEINNGDYIAVKGVDFANGAKSVEVNISPIYGGNIEIHADEIDGSLIATVEVDTTREEGIWSTFTAPVNTNIKGVHDVYFVFKGKKDLFYFDWWKLN
ncbi:glycoside hydrolase family 43 protein [Leeuwenhoekiella polynyae]|uniref:Carbohydrate binding protein with CBM6 domain n=1 Tax=Leeuwenhoekiella polynyae TaxID=1550906 RepID=A0A4Q0P2D2_9FLAO|nr:glycoside hydrolase family 43 protein [Leeuwenhoekiella polynyae]RXG20375.1 carbohydrate binding protein with CBM6 domain [Leeuwenhoekiella polynyae]